MENRIVADIVRPGDFSGRFAGVAPLQGLVAAGGRSASDSGPSSRREPWRGLHRTFAAKMPSNGLDLALVQNLWILLKNGSI
jgi:hypothetical protein